jgi:hypothetical protein
VNFKSAFIIQMRYGRTALDMSDCLRESVMASDIEKGQAFQFVKQILWEHPRKMIFPSRRCEISLNGKRCLHKEMRVKGQSAVRKALEKKNESRFFCIKSQQAECSE